MCSNTITVSLSPVFNKKSVVIEQYFLSALELGLVWKPVPSSIVIVISLFIGVPCGLSAYLHFGNAAKLSAIIALIGCGVLIYSMFKSASLPGNLKVVLDSHS